MGWRITLGTMIDSMPQEPTTRKAIYEASKYGCSVNPCRSCSGMFSQTWRLARRMGLIVQVGRKFALRGWDAVEPYALEDLNI
jgi:hypothetical protein